MIKKCKTILKNIVITVTCVATVTSAIISSIPSAKADSSGILGTSAALGSPILNNNFTVENWNKWEMICWGVFLSNFCQPLIDNYESAFKTGAGGSNGAGFQALVFGSGNDSTNNETIEAFCDYAINQQKSIAKKEIYVGFTEIKDGVLQTTPNPNDANSGANLRQATFNDFFFKYEAEANKTSFTTVAKIVTNTKSNTPEIEGSAPDLVVSYQSIAQVQSGYIPTFYITNSSNKYVKILDYTNSWDVQMASAILNAVKHDTATQEAFLNSFEALKTSDSPITLDVFGNIMVENKMLLPASANQNITKERQINLLNSWIMNGYTSTYSTDKLILGLEQNTHTGLFGSELPKLGGYPAFGKSNIGNIGLLYYDTDAIAAMDFAKFKKLNYGETLEKLFNLDITATNNKYPLKFEVAGVGNIDATWYGAAKYEDIDATTLATSLLSNCNPIETQPEVLSKVILVDGSEVQLFSNKPVIVANQLGMAKENKEPTKTGAVRNYYNFLYKAYTGDTTEGTLGTFDKSSVTRVLNKSATANELYDNTKGEVWSKFQSYSNTYKNTKIPSNLFDIGDANSINTTASRLCLVYPISDTMKNVSSVLGLQDGTEFSAYSAMIYMTYLDWYGIFNKTTLTTGTEASSNFNTDIYNTSSDVLKVDPSSIADFKSEEDMEDEVLQMSYLMLHPEEGREYRKNLMYTGISDFMYEQYNRMVYGGASSTYEGSASKSNSGFLAVETYADNWLTSWFLDNYIDIAVTLIAVCCVLIVIVGLIRSKNMSWYLFSLFTVINVILLVPSSGDIVPYITSNFIQNIFKDNMTYWSISENIANEALEEEAAAKATTTDTGDEDANALLKLINQLEIVYTDRSLMMKQDTSQKLTQKIGGIYTDIQNIQSARWILPMVMQQFTGDNGTDDYVYVKLGNMWDDGTVLHWYYTNEGAEAPTKKTTISQQFESNKARIAAGTELYHNRSNFYADAVKVDNWDNDKNTDINYANYAYTLRGDPDKITHLSSYILPDSTMQARKRVDTLGANGENYKNTDSWQSYIDYCKKQFGAEKKASDTWKTNKDTSKGGVSYERVSAAYDRTDISSLMPGQSYFKTTESPYYYFFNVVKDSFDDTKTVGSVIGILQGQIEEDSEGNEVRHNIMYATKTTSKEEVHGSETKDVGYTGYIRDCLDLQEFFTNTVPYMYEMTIISGGFDGESGVLHNEKITDNSSLYEGNLMSWAYRCNWAVKLMENPSYSESKKIKDKDGNVYTVNNPMLPECYPGYDKGRPMIFSEAQMKAYGLKQSDLNIVELKCVEVNKQVAKKWTLLINYAGTSGLTKEVLYRQMATDATTIFNQEFSSNGILNTKYTLYPQSIDLRYLSFDSVMKMLMINISQDSSYVYGDTMQKLLSDTDMITAFLLLTAACLCAAIVPLARMILMALIFYLGFISIVRAILSSNKYKSKIACGQLVTNLLFMEYTLIYYSFFGLLMSISSSDEVLSIDSVSSNPGNPIWVLLAIIIASILYIVLMWKQICFCIKHYRDMGSDMYAMIAGAMTERLTGAIGSLHSKITGGSKEKSSSKSDPSIRDIASMFKSSNSSKSTTTTTTTTTTTSTSTSTVVNNDGSTSSNTSDSKQYTDTNKDYTEDTDEIDISVLNDIEKEIEAGSKL